ncbi:MAG: chemotaxis protein CheA [Spirochaetes bacterium]|nr:chemotaxis protein CheA [Spirochaetota bacterium]
MPTDYNLNKIKQTFFIESREMLEEMERCLLELEKNTDSEETINALFRSVHTIKGSSGMFGYHEIEKFTHIVENILDRFRKGEILMDSTLSSTLFACHDCIQELFNLFEENENSQISPEMREKMNDLTNRLNTYSLPENKIPVNDNAEPQENNGKSSAMANDSWHISLRFGKDVFRNALDPYSFINYLNEIGQITQIVTITDDIPKAEDMNPEDCYLGFEINFKGDVDKKAIEDVFEFVKDNCEIRILPPNSSIDKYMDLLSELPESSEQLGEMLVSIGVITTDELDAALKAQQTKSDSTDKNAEKALLGDILLEQNIVHKQVLDAALNKQQEIKKSEKKNLSTLRINGEKINQLINLVGELVIRSSNVEQLSLQTGDTELAESVSDMIRLIEEIRGSTMSIRMVPIVDTFKKYERIVRDLSKERGKEIDLIIAGGDTELDKMLVDKISDPLMHLIRNSIDHGIDTPEERLRKGKPRRGTIYLNAYNEMGGVVIVASDDGNGLDKDRIYEKAVDIGFIQAGENIPDNDLFQLIFEPGFSTAREVTNISGRGVGMDVVRRNIEGLQGSVALESVKGAGTTVKIYLPLTLAIIDGFMVQVGLHHYVIPQEMVIECTDIEKEKLMIRGGGNFMDLRGDALPYMRLRDFFDENSTTPEKENMIVVEHGSRTAGLVVDSPKGGVQAVIKPLGKVFSQLKWISGATILGNGDVALILDIPKLIQKIEGKSAVRSERQIGN